MTEKIAALIPARGGSKSIPLKNIALFANKPLLYWSLNACENSRLLDHAYVATDSDKIGDTVLRMEFDNVSVIGRSAESALDTASSEKILIEFAQQHAYEHIMLVQATSPLITAEDIDRAIEKYFSCGADSLLSGVRIKRFIWKKDREFVKPMNYDPKNRPLRQSWDGQLIENGAIYITNREALLRSRCRLSGNIAFYEMPEETYHEIDEPVDWQIAEQLLQARLEFYANLDDGVEVTTQIISEK